jgi:hypothetical protein
MYALLPASPFLTETTMRDSTPDLSLKIELHTPDFFFIPTKKVEIETVPETGRTYFLYKGAIVAVGKRH